MVRKVWEWEEIIVRKPRKFARVIRLMASPRHSGADRFLINGN